ncbi:hypothetical protein BJ170DRAFT_598404 [Xylariales sp. AK1849]|nr:hypothetical protein BJ170DRAFT_598404 [Xylariales sp. AK1849]
MKSVALSHLFVILAMSMTITAAVPLDITGDNTMVSSKNAINNCSKDAITKCVAESGLDTPACFARICTSGTGANELRRRQDDSQCTEDNLLDCAVTQWKNPDICFQEFCL